MYRGNSKVMTLHLMNLLFYIDSFNSLLFCCDYIYIFKIY